VKNPVGSITSNAANLAVTSGTVIAAPTLLLPPNGVLSASPTQRFVWNKGAAGVTRYWFELSTDSLFLTQRTVDSTRTDTTKDMTGLTNGASYWWKVRAGDAGGWGTFSSVWRLRISATDVAEDRGTPTTIALEQNYPNPFNPSTTIRYSLPAKSSVQLRVFNTLGVEVAVLQNGEQEMGYYEVRFNAQGLSSGIYFYRLQVGNYTETRRLLLVR
jgi:hypothetical protein